MTDEQIKQNAEAYSDKNCIFDYNSVENDAVINAFIAGAHSRDKELEDMEFMITKLEHEKALLRQGYKLLEDKLNKIDSDWMHK